MGIPNEGFPERSEGRPVFVERIKDGIVRVGLATVAVVSLISCSGGEGEGSTPTTTEPQVSIEGETTTTTVTPGETTSTTNAGRPSGTPGTELPPNPTTTSQPAAACEETRRWNTEPESTIETAPGLAADLYLVKVGLHECFDRMVFVVNGATPEEGVVGHSVRYVPGDVTDAESGEPVPTEGPTTMEVVINAPPQGWNPLSQSQPARRLAPDFGEDIAVQGSMEGSVYDDVTLVGLHANETTIAVGLKPEEERDFAVNAYESDGRTMIYIDVER